MSNLMSSQGMALATAMAVSGTVLLLTFCRQKPFFSSTLSPDHSESHIRNLRSCIYSKEEKKRKKAKKRVHFAEDVVDPTGNSEDFRREHRKTLSSYKLSQNRISERKEVRDIPQNRMALYNGILRDRIHRTTFSSVC